MPKSIVIVKNLSKVYDGNSVVDNISFEVKKGEIFGILGPNGAGKTTTLEMIETMREIDDGTISVDGIYVSKDPDSIKRIIGVQPQSPAFQDKTKLTEVIELFAAALTGNCILDCFSRIPLGIRVLQNKTTLVKQP